MARLDNVWKETLREFLLPMIESVLPDLYAAIDTKKTPEFLDKEAKDITLELSGNVKNTVKEVDLLVDLPMKNKVRGSVRVLLHCEVQGGGGKEDLNFRMYCYKSLLTLRYKKPIVALAIITEPLPKDQMSGRYREKDFGGWLTYKFNVLKVFEAKAKLSASENPFDIVQLAAARAWRARRSESSRLGYLKELVKLLDEKGWDHKKKYNLAKFLETIFKIRTPELQSDYLSFIEANKTREVKTMLMIEKRAIKQGMEKGMEKGMFKGIIKGKLEDARKMLEIGLSLEVIKKVTGLSEAEIC